MRYLHLLLAALCLLSASAPTWAANPARLRDVTYADGLVSLVFTEPTNYKTSFWKSNRKFIVDVESAGVDLRIEQLPVNSPRLDAVRWGPSQNGAVRVVLDLKSAELPRVLASNPTNIIAVRVAAPGSPAAVADAPDPAAPPAATAPSNAPAAISDIEVLRGENGRPERIIVRTDREVTARAEWINNRLAIDIPEMGRTPERIVPVNDPVLLRVRAGTSKGQGRVMVDATRRFGYKLSALEDGRGFALDCLLPEPDAPAAPMPPGPDGDDLDVTWIAGPIGDSLKGRLIVLDAGHGAHDHGARSQWATEKIVNLDIAQRMRRLLVAAGARVEMTRSADTFVPLRERPALAMRLNADVFISIHHNSSVRPTNTGTEVFHRRNDAESKRLASALYRAHRATTGLRGRGVKSDSTAPQGGLAVLKNTTVPSALVEVAFLNNPGEGKKVADPAWRQSVAEGLVKGLARFMEGQG